MLPTSSESSRIASIEPFRDARWAVLVAADPNSSVFHSSAWLQALQRTYRFSPIAFVIGPPGGPPTAGLVFCRVDSWLTGRRLVSLPFSDHCEPLVSGEADLQRLVRRAQQAASGLRYLELRPFRVGHGVPEGFQTDDQYCIHTLDLRPALEHLYAGLHKNSVQRKIRRAEREGLALEAGRSDQILREFYGLLVRTRRRHRRPPQPLKWFRNLADCFGDDMVIQVARKGQTPIASIITLRHKDKLVYKYGCSDERYHPMGGMALLFWRAIQDAKSMGLTEFDLGRSEIRQDGLIRFKEGLGAKRTALRYWRWSSGGASRVGAEASSRLGEQALSRLPDRMFRLVGRILYRHVG